MMNSTSTQGLRHFVRIPFAAEVQLRVHEGPIQCELVDIALKGALVRTAELHALVPQEKCRLVLPLTDGGDSIEMEGRIVHLQDRQVGIECQQIEVNSLTRLRRLIELNTGDPDLMHRELSLLFGAR